MYFELLEQAQTEGKRRYAQWKSELFEQATGGPALKAWSGLAGHANRQELFRCYLDFLVEAIGRGYVDRALLNNATGGGTLAALVVSFLPRHLAAMNTNRLVELWNIAEGIRGYAPWLDSLIAPALLRLRDPKEVEAFVVKTMEFVYQDGSPGWEKYPLLTQVVNLSEYDERFFPGTLRFVTHRVLAVCDRREERELAVAIFPDEIWVASAEPLPEKGPNPSPIPLVLNSEEVRIGEISSAFPGLNTWQHVVASPCGFVVGTCVDSQMLWVGRARSTALEYSKANMRVE